MVIGVLHEVPTDELRLRLVADETVIGRARAHQIETIRELDRRQAATADGCGSLAEWVAGRVDVAPETAQKLVTTAKALGALEYVTGALVDGETTYDRAAAIAKIATADDELEILVGSYDCDIAGLRRRAARRSRVTRYDEEQAFSERYLSVQPTLDGMSWRIHGRLAGAAGSIVTEALSARADEFAAFPDGTRAPLSQRRADALVAICQDASTPGTSTGESTGGSVTVFVDATHASATSAETGVALAAGPRVGVHALESILCDGTVEVTAVTADGTPLGIGRRTRVVPPRLRRFVLFRDGGCVADGCDSTYRLQAHHKIPYSEGGRTDPDNLVTLCWFHHHVVIHGHGFTIDPNSKPGRIRFRPPRGSPRDPPPWNL